MKSTLPILYNYKPYNLPKNGLFSVMKDNAKYSLKSGCETENIQIKIIGETNNEFVYELKQSEQGYWIGDKVVTEKYILPMGIHKTRLVQWLNVQLSLFD